MTYYIQSVAIYNGCRVYEDCVADVWETLARMRQTGGPTLWVYDDVLNSMTVEYTKTVKLTFERLCLGCGRLVGQHSKYTMNYYVQLFAMFNDCRVYEDCVAVV